MFTFSPRNTVFIMSISYCIINLYSDAFDIDLWHDTEPIT